MAWYPTEDDVAEFRDNEKHDRAIRDGAVECAQCQALLTDGDGEKLCLACEKSAEISGLARKLMGIPPK